MIEIIGFKRAIILAALIVTNIALAALLYAYMIPQDTTLTRKYSVLKRQVTSAQSDLDRMQIEFEQLEEQQDLFDALKEDGFFTTQVRSDAKTLFADIRRDSRVISAVANVRPGIVEDNTEARKVKYKILTSLIKVEIKAFDDADIYHYLELAEKRFPGHLSLDSITLRRSRDIDATLLRSIASGSSPELVSATVHLSWRTLIPEDQVIDQKAGGAR